MCSLPPLVQSSSPLPPLVPSSSPLPPLVPSSSPLPPLARPAHLRLRWLRPVRRFPSAPEIQLFPSAPEMQRFPSAPESQHFPSAPESLCFSSAPKNPHFLSALRPAIHPKRFGGGGDIPVVLVAIVAMHGTLVRATMAPLARPSQKIIPLVSTLLDSIS